MADISRVKLGGTTYNVKDTVARAGISAGLQLVKVTTLPTAAESTMGKIYLVPSTDPKEGQKDIYTEYVTVRSGEEGSYTYAWERLGTTDVKLSDYSTKNHFHNASSSAVTFEAHTTDKVLGEGTSFTNGTSQVTFEESAKTDVLGSGSTFANASSAVSFAAHTKDKALGEATTFTNADSSVSFAAHTTDKALGEATTFTNDTSEVTFAAEAKTNVLGSGSTFANASSAVSFSGQTTKKLEKSTVRGVQSTEESIKEFLPTDASGYSMIAAKYTADATGDDGTLDLEILTGTEKTFAKMDSSTTTIATGNVVDSGEGADVITAVGTGTAAAQVITVTPETIAAVTGNGTAAAQNITVGTNDKVDAITALGAGTAAAQVITVGNNDKVDAITALGAGTAAAQVITVTPETIAAVTGTGTAAAQVITVGTEDKVDAITALGAGTAAAQTISTAVEPS